MSAVEGVRKRVREILAQVLGVPGGEIGPGFSSESAPDWTSLNHLMLISQLESDFGVVFSSQEVQQLTSFDRLVDAITERRGRAG